MGTKNNGIPINLVITVCIFFLGIAIGGLLVGGIVADRFRKEIRQGQIELEKDEWFKCIPVLQIKTFKEICDENETTE